MSLREKLVRLAHANPSLRADLLPLLAKTSGRQEEMEEENSRAQVAMATKEWSRIAKEPLKVERDGFFLNAYGSELAVLRLFLAFNLVKRGKNRVDFVGGSWRFQKADSF